MDMFKDFWSDSLKKYLSTTSLHLYLSERLKYEIGNRFLKDSERIFKEFLKVYECVFKTFSKTYRRRFLIFYIEDT